VGGAGGSAGSPTDACTPPAAQGVDCVGICGWTLETRPTNYSYYAIDEDHDGTTGRCSAYYSCGMTTVPVGPDYAWILPAETGWRDGGLWNDGAVDVIGGHYCDDVHLALEVNRPCLRFTSSASGRTFKRAGTGETPQACLVANQGEVVELRGWANAPHWVWSKADCSCP
jgi:hypothetical protein